MCLAVPGRLISVDHTTALPTGTVDFGGTRRDVCLSFVPEVAVGDHVMVHVGFALAVVDEAAAAAALKVLEAPDP